MSAAAADHGDHGEHHHPNYVRVWLILLVLLAVSVIGPTFEIPWLTLVTAFGIAIVKAYMVAVNFMHLNVEKKIVVYLLSTCLIFMLLFFAGVAPDVMKYEGDNWVKAQTSTQLKPVEHHGEHGEEHGGDHGGGH